MEAIVDVSVFNYISSSRDLDLWRFDPILPTLAEPPITHTNQFKNAFLENVFCDFDRWSDDLQNPISS